MRPFHTFTLDACFPSDCRFNLSEYYVGEHDRDYICSQSHEHGMTKCEELPPYVLDGQRCNLSADDVRVQLSDSWNQSDTGSTPPPPPPPDAGCVDWNRYYSSCLPVGNNPFLGAISFDNIGLAWVAIFQVRNRTSRRVSTPARLYASAGTSYGPVSVRLCLSQVGVLSTGINRLVWFLAWRLLLTSPTLFCKEIQVSTKNNDRLTTFFS